VFGAIGRGSTRLADFREDEVRHADLARRFEDAKSQPDWVGPFFPLMPLIANDTTVVIVTNERVASAGEGLVMRASRAENVVRVGKNTMGCLTFGNAGLHQLPHSRLRLKMPINFGLFMDGKSREEKGISPDFWVPAADAVNCAVAAIRNGTIKTYQPLPATILEESFVPEDPWARVRRERLLLASLIALFGAGAGVWSFFMRAKPRVLVGAGFVWLTIGVAWVGMEKPIGWGFLLIGAVCLASGGIFLANSHSAPIRIPRPTPSRK
jgi:hypothetical protein